jgi:hypothetical protein
MINCVADTVPDILEMDSHDVADMEGSHDVADVEGSLDDVTFDSILAAVDASMEKDDASLTHEASDKDKDVAMTDGK